MNEHGCCPSCNTNLDGGSIWQHFFEKSGSETEADITAAMYGATRERGQWGRAVAIYDIQRDRATQYECPDCKHVWNR